MRLQYKPNTYHPQKNIKTQNVENEKDAPIAATENSFINQTMKRKRKGSRIYTVGTFPNKNSHGKTKD